MTSDLFAATVRLADTLEAENAALQAMDLPAAAAMLAEKQAATDAFNMARGHVPAPLCPALREAASRLIARAEENRTLLERCIKVQTRVLGVIADAARASNPMARYGRSGGYAKRTATAWAFSARA